ncbi:MAG: nucleotidyltransferase domain-containing protein [Nitrospinae bacterium]|nr:nucleotidyltransferase domain-containing protein [Nitrospinota bacterium]
MKPELQPILTELRERLTDLYGMRLQQMSLFGSQARGDSTPGSDIDILIVLLGEVDPAEEIARTGGITSGISLDHDVVVSCVFMSSDRYETEQSPLLLNIRRESVPV